MPANVQQVVNTMGLSPAELTGISSQQVQRDRNLISLLGAASTIKRNRVLNRESEKDIQKKTQVEIEMDDGEKFYTTRGQMATAMSQMAQRKKTQADTVRTEYDNQPMTVMIGGAPFNLKRYEFKEISGILDEQERLGQTREMGDRAQQAQDWKAEAIAALGAPDAQVTPEIMAKLGEVPGMPGADAKTVRQEKERLSQLRKDWNGLHMALNAKPEHGGEEPYALASSANAIAEELGENVAMVVFPKDTPGMGKDMLGFGPSHNIIKMTDLRNPMTGQPMSIGEVREQATADGMRFNDALMIMHLYQKGLEGK